MLLISLTIRTTQRHELNEMNDRPTQNDRLRRVGVYFVGRVYHALLVSFLYLYLIRRRILFYCQEVFIFFKTCPKF